MPVFIESQNIKLMCSNHKVAKIYCQNSVVYSSGNICTYHVDTGAVYQEEVDEGQSCLHPASFAPEKEGWEFVGWKLSDAAELPAEEEVLMGDDPITLYALFKQDITLTTVANGTTNRETKPRLYNNGNLANPAFTVSSPSRAGATFKGWSASAGSTTISNSSISNLSLAVSTTRYAVFTYADYVITPNASFNPSTGVMTGFCDEFGNRSSPGRPYLWAKGIYGYIAVDCDYPVDIFSGCHTIYFFKYGSITIEGSRWIGVNFKDNEGWLKLNGGGSTVTLLHAKGGHDDYGCGDGINSSSVPINFAWAATSGSGTLTLTYELGAGSSSTTQQNFRVYKFTIHGRTVVG